MKLEHKIGIGITCTFLCLCGAVIGLKMQEQTPPAESQQVAVPDPTPVDPPKEQSTPPATSSDSPPPRRHKEDNPPPPAPETVASGSRSTPPSPASASAGTNTPSTLNRENPSGLSNKSIVPISGLPGNQLDASKGRVPPISLNPLPVAPKVQGAKEFGSFGGNSASGSSGNKTAPPETLALPPSRSETTRFQPPPYIIPTSATAQTPSLSPPPPSATPKPTGSVPSPSAASISGQGPSSSPNGSATPQIVTPPERFALSATSSSPPAPVRPKSESTTGGTPSGLPPLTGGSSATGATPIPPPVGNLTSVTPSIENKTPPTRDPAFGTGAVKPSDSIKPSAPSSVAPPPPASSAPNPWPSSMAPSPVGTAPSLNPKPQATSISPVPLTSSPQPPLAPPTPLAPPSSPSPTLSSPVPLPNMPAPPTAPTISTPTPLPAPSAPTPPPLKPPEGSSSFVPDNRASSSSTPGSFGNTAPAPLPTIASPSTPIRPVASAPPPNNNRADVKYYDEQTYEVRPGDTYESISKRFLMTDKFAKALQLHNRNHPRAGREMANSGTLTPGEKVYIPQAYILEERYGGVISNTTPAAPPLQPVSSPTPPPIR
jgi:hypothetical protein